MPKKTAQRVLADFVIYSPERDAYLLDADDGSEGWVQSPLFVTGFATPAAARYRIRAGLTPRGGRFEVRGRERTCRITPLGVSVSRPETACGNDSKEAANSAETD